MRKMVAKTALAFLAVTILLFSSFDFMEDKGWGLFPI